MSKNLKFKRITALMLAIIMIAGIIPARVFADELKGDTNGNGTIDVYLTITEGPNNMYRTIIGQRLFLEELNIPYFDLSLYELGDYYYNENFYPSPDEWSGGIVGGEGTTPGDDTTANGVVTTIHAFIYATEKYVLGLDSGDMFTGEYDISEYISWTGGAGSAYMNFWNGSENLNYYLDYEFPHTKDNPNLGTTADQQPLEDGMVISVHLIEDNSAYGTNYGFFKTSDGKRDFATIQEGDSVDLTFYRSIESWSYDGTVEVYPVEVTPAEVYCTDSEGFELFKADKKQNITNWTYIGDVDEYGKISIPSDLNAGTYYIAGVYTDGILYDEWTYMSYELSPAVFVLTVTADEPSHSHEYTILGHDDENHWYECACGEKDAVEAHNQDNSIEGKPATCEEPGLTEGKKCSVCDTVTVAQKGIPESGHKFTNYVSNNDAECEKDGTKTAECDNGCGEKNTITDEGSALKHKFTEYVSNNDAECEKDGTKTAKCDNEGCEETDTVTDEGSALKHKFTEYVSNNDAECEKDGTKTAKCDNGCGETDTVTDEGSALKHSFTNYVSNNDAECEVDGTKTAKCDNGCGEKNTVTDEGSALKHKFTNYVSNNDAECEVDGTKTAKCDHGCGETDTVTDAGSALEHSFTEYVSNDDAKCAIDGTKTAKCDNGCGEKNTITDEGSALKHKFTEYVSNNDAECEKDGTKTAKCDNEGCEETDTLTDEGSKLGHKEEVIPGKPATCTEDGLTEGKKCSVCGTVTVKQEEIAALGHTEVVDKAVSPTCTEAGKTEGKHCSVCGEVLLKQETVAALGHKEDAVPGKAATCTETGLTEGKKCSVCGTITVPQEEIAALGHKEESIPGKPATETETGLTEGKKCSVCGEILVAQEVIPKLEKELVFGDANGDGKVNALDATQILRFANNKPSSLSGVEEGTALFKALDVNNDGKINALDATQILRYANNKASVFDK